MIPHVVIGFHWLAVLGTSLAFLVHTFNATMCLVLSSRARYTLPGKIYHTEQVSRLHASTDLGLECYLPNFPRPRGRPISKSAKDHCLVFCVAAAHGGDTDVIVSRVPSRAHRQEQNLP